MESSPVFLSKRLDLCVRRGDKSGKSKEGFISTLIKTHNTQPLRCFTIPEIARCSRVSYNTGTAAYVVWLYIYILLFQLILSPVITLGVAFQKWWAPTASLKGTRGFGTSEKLSAFTLSGFVFSAEDSTDNKQTDFASSFNISLLSSFSTFEFLLFRLWPSSRLQCFHTMVMKEIPRKSIGSHMCNINKSLHETYHSDN